MALPQTRIGGIQVVDTLSDIKRALRQDFCVCVSVQDSLSDDWHKVVAEMSADNRQNLRGLRIEGGKENGLAIYGGGSSRPSRSLNCPSVPKVFGIPESLVALATQDHLDYLEATGQDYATSVFRVGDELAVDWHEDKNLTPDKPQAHRDLSGDGMYIVNANEECLLSIQREHHSATFISDSEIGQKAATGQIKLRRQNHGERLYFRNKFLHRSATSWNESIVMPHIRFLTRGPL